MSELEVFWGSGSQPAWRVLLALEAKGLPYRSHLLSFSKAEHKTPEFLSMNPRHQVPVLRRGDFSLYESVAIMAYLDAAFPERPLFGTDPETTGTVWRHVLEFGNHADPAWSTIIQAIFFNKVEERRARVDEALPRAKAEWALLEERLKGRDWLVGDSFSGADCVVFPVLMAMVRAAGKPAAADIELSQLGTTTPAIASWVRRIEALPGYENAYPPHWREG